MCKLFLHQSANSSHESIHKTLTWLSVGSNAQIQAGHEKKQKANNNEKLTKQKYFYTSIKFRHL